ncbi:PKD domain-containing protein [Amycolatopsis sp.]|uniref:PKD domain-containing protein n=1 Tax=Amycolatopsis sp. TaxID=37632 RepID=UPI002C1D206B|nr:PKD domain-containing protein [Amycolatopsis sp.]HVV08070.1 PKD domain-containing protein [Amycolatopsis sp.]
MTASIECASYRVTDSYFGEPYVDVDEWREQPHPHRHVHGGFSGCDTRFTFYFPAAAEWQGRLIQPMEGAHAGHEDFFGGALGDAMGGVGLTARLGGYMVESNMGHIGDDIDPKGGEDATLYGWRAAAEAARFSKHVAAQVYGSPPHHAYVWGGSGGGRRSPLLLENAPDVFDGALPFMGGGDVADFPATERIRGAQVMSFACMFNVQRLLRDKMEPLVDATRPGGSGDPFAGLTSHEREELASLYRQGFPRGDEYMIGAPMGQIWLWSSIADQLFEQDPAYFENFWTQPGYVGHDHPEAVRDDVLDVVTTVERVVTIGELAQDPEFAGPEYQLIRGTAQIIGASGGADLPYAVVLRDLPAGYRLGTGLRVASGEAEGRQLYCTGTAGELLVADGRGEANLQRFRGVRAGDEIHVDNRRFLAFCYFHRHHLMADPQFDSLRVNGIPVYPQHPVPLMSPLMGVSYTGHYSGKLLWIHHTHDSSLWPSQGLIYASAVRATQGEEGAAERFRLQWTENAEHIPPVYLPDSPSRASSTWLVDYFPIIEQGLADLIRWVEDGEAPPATTYSYRDGQVGLPATASGRGGVQPVVVVEANGEARTEVKAGDPVELTVRAEAPPAGGTIVSVEWDFDGHGTFPFRPAVSGAEKSVSLTTTHVYDAPGTYFATARVCGHRDGDGQTPFRRLPNVASARVVVS